jgi:Protein of unknown function (DUF2591)
MKKIKLDDATNLQLDYLVAKREGGTEFMFDGITWGFTLGSTTRVLSRGWGALAYCPSTSYGLIGELCHKHGVSVTNPHIDSWWATLGDPADDCAMGMFDTTPQRAACKALLLDQADEQGCVEVPEELA